MKWRYICCGWKQGSERTGNQEEEEEKRQEKKGDMGMMKNGMKRGSAMLEVLVIMMVFMVFTTTMFTSAAAMHQRGMRNIAKNEAYHAALTAVRLMEEEITKGGAASDFLVKDGGMEPRETNITVVPEDGSAAFSVPVTVASKRDGDRLILYGEAVSDGQRKAVSMILVKQENGDWIPSEYGRDRIVER